MTSRSSVLFSSAIRRGGRWSSIVNSRPAGIIKCLLLSWWIETMGAKIRLRRRWDYIAGSASSRSLLFRFITDISERSFVIRDAPPQTGCIGTIELIRGGCTRVDWTRARRSLPAIEQSRGFEYSLGTGRKSRLFSVTEPFLCFALELRFAIKSPSRTLSFDARWRPASIFRDSRTIASDDVPQTRHPTAADSLYNSWTRKHHDKD